YEEKTAFVFDITTGEQIAAYEHDNNVREIAYSPSGRFIATACVDKKAYLWDAPEDPQPTSQKSPALSPLDLPAVVPEGEPSEGSDQQGYEYANFFDLSAAADRSIVRHQPTSTTPRRSLSRFKHAITRQLNRREGSRAGGEETGRGPSWWKRMRRRATDQTPPVDDDQPNPKNSSTDISDHTQRPPGNDEGNSGSSRTGNTAARSQRVQVAAGRDKTFWVIVDDIVYTPTKRILFMFFYCRRPPVEDAEEVEPVQNAEVTVVVPSMMVPPQSSSPNNVASVGPSDPVAAQPALPVVVISPPVDTSTAAYPSSSPDLSPTLSLTSPSQPSPLTPPALPSSASFTPTSPMVDTIPSSLQDTILSLLPADEASILREYQRQKSRFAAATGTPSEPLHDIESIASQSQSIPSLQTLGPIVHHSPSSRSSPSPRHLSLLDSLLGVQDTSSLPQPSSLSSDQPSSSSIALITDTDSVDAAGPLSPAPAEQDLEPDAPLLMSPLSALWAGSRTDIEMDSSPMLEYENPWASG
ncbi:hypothetical protein HYDPIDRAFT_32158, partial [Hydnomerulius pinastri MD-312]